MTTAAFITFIAAIDARKQRQQAEKDRMERQRQQQQRHLNRHSIDDHHHRSSSSGNRTSHSITHTSQGSFTGRSTHLDRMLRPLNRYSCPTRSHNTNPDGTVTVVRAQVPCSVTTMPVTTTTVNASCKRQCQHRGRTTSSQCVPESL